MRVRKDLTDRAVRNLGPGYHAAGRSLYVQVTDRGSRSWILRTLYRGKRLELGLGSYPSVSLAEAREEAERGLKKARRGEDPRPKAPTKIPTFAECVATVHGEHKDGWRNSKHAAQWLSTLKIYAFPVIGTLPVSEVDTHHVLSVLTPIWTARPETSRRVRQRVGLVLDWARAQKYRTGDNPCDDIARVLPKQPDTKGEKRKHPSLPYAQVPGFVVKLRDCSASESIRLALEFCILTAARTGEVLGARWDEIDPDEAAWTIPASRMKAGNEHRVPLSERALAILQAAKDLGGKTHVFPAPGSKDAPLSNMAMAMVLRRMGYSVTVHGFRSSFRVWAAERTNYPRGVCEAALAHTVKGVEGDYQRSDLFDRRRDLMHSWAAHVSPATAKVIKIRA